MLEAPHQILATTGALFGLLLLGLLADALGRWTRPPRVTLGSTVIFELAGPPLTKLTLWRVGALELSGKPPMAKEGGRWTS